MTDIKYKLIVGLEIHVQLCTKTKMFCGCELAFAQTPNSRVCPVCLGMPGSLPVMNKQAVEFSALTAMALSLEVPKFTKWDRKNYYYPDLPKNYQISQYDLPISENGHIEIPLESGETKKIRLIRAHLEEDAGKNTHTSGNYSQVDLNRAGTPLLEIVTEPDMNSADEVKALAVELQRIVRYLRVSEADMQKGHMRFEPNINLTITKDGVEYRTPITEIKNLNSFRALERSVDYEVPRQLDEFERTGKTIKTGLKTTRGWDDDKQETVLQREKELSSDYRYFHDPDLVPVEMSQQWRQEIKSRLCELPLAKQRKYVSEYKLSDYDAGVLTADKATAEFFEAIVAAGADAKRTCNLISQVGLKLANEKNCSIVELELDAKDMADLAKMVEDGKISASSGNRIMEVMAESHEKPKKIAHDLKLIQESDTDQLSQIVDDVLAENPQAVSDATSGSKKSKASRGFLLGQVMKKSAGQANPQVVAKILNKKLS